MIELKRCTSANADFIQLVQLLDQDLATRDGDDHAFYHQFNKIDIQHAVVAYHNGQPAGCGAIKPFNEQSTEVKRMYVMPAYRNKGIASLVLAELETFARELGYKYCVLETGKKQPEAIALYQKQGYKLTPNYGQYIGVENSVCMRKEV